MDILCITDAVKKFDISSKTLRYYENVGILKASRMDNKYRYYDKEAVDRIKQILILRKMQISIKDIIRIYENQTMSTVVEIFVNRINAIDEEVNALSELKRITNEFLQRMISNGITKISALPLLYEEMDKQLEVTHEHKSFSYNELSNLNAKLVKELDIRIIILPQMRVLLSILKDGNKPDTDYFWKWVNDNHIEIGTPGSHQLFEMQRNTESNTYQETLMLKIPFDYNNTSPFSDRVFKGGLFAVTSAYVDELDTVFRTLIKMLDDNQYYEIDYLHSGELRHAPLAETIISPDELREKIDIFVPIKKRLADVSNYNNETQDVLDVALLEIENANPVGKAISVDLKAMGHIGTRAVNSMGSFDYKFFEYNDKDEIELHSYLLARQLVSNEKIKIPFMVEIEFQILDPLMELRICHDIGHIEIRFSNENMQLTVREPVFGTEHRHIISNNINFGQNTKLNWFVGEKYFAIVIDGEVKYCSERFAYMQIDRNTFKEHPVRIAAAHNYDSVTVKSIKIYPIIPEKINKLKKGELNMITKQSNNILPNLHPLLTWHYGENYDFNASMRMLMEYVEPNEIYSYSFFAGISGDNFVQVYGRQERYERYNGCLSYVWDGQEFIKYVFDEIGYEYTYVTAEQFAGNKSMYIETIKAYIDKGIPVLMYGCINPIVGYEENGKVLLFMDGENTQPNKMNTDENISQDYIFIGAKKKETDLRKIFINSFAHIAELLESPDKYGCSFGPKAFRTWADDIENGRFDGMTQEQFDGWKYYSVYICNMATNFCGISYDFLERAEIFVPELSGLRDKYIQMNEWDGIKIGNELQRLEGNFNVTLAALQDKERRKAIANEIRKFAPIYKDFVRMIKEKLVELK